MKKLIAVILAVLLLGSAVAYAETATALDLKDPKLDLAMYGENVTIDLAGLTLRFGAFGEEDGVLALNILGNGELLFAAAARVDDGRLLLAADGLSHSYSVAIPASEMVGEADDDEGGELSNIGAELMEKLMAEAEIGMDGDKITFRLPYTAVNALLREILPLTDKIPNADELLQELDEMEAQGQGVELSGFVSMNGGFRVELNATPVSNGVPEGEPVFCLDFDLETLSNGGDFYLTITVPSEGSEPVFRAEGSYRTSGSNTSVHVVVYASAEAVSAGAPSAVLDLSVGEDFSLKLMLPEASFSCELKFTPADGMLLLAVETDDFSARLTTVVVTGEAELSACAFPASVIEIDGELSEEQSEELSSELMAALTPVLSFVMPALSSSGLLG